LWQAGTYEPHINPYAWTNLTNMIYIDQPISTGFSPGNLTVNNEHEVATHFKAFWKNFVDTFDIYDFRVYLAGESYAGQYIPYIASEMLNEQDSKYFDVQGILIFDPSINVEDVMTQGMSMRVQRGKTIAD
jgi:carboxypeptidase D